MALDPRILVGPPLGLIPSHERTFSPSSPTNHLASDPQNWSPKGQPLSVIDDHFHLDGAVGADLVIDPPLRVPNGDLVENVVGMNVVSYDVKGWVTMDYQADHSIIRVKLAADRASADIKTVGDNTLFIEENVTNGSIRVHQADRGTLSSTPDNGYVDLSNHSSLLVDGGLKFINASTVRLTNGAQAEFNTVYEGPGMISASGGSVLTFDRNVQSGDKIKLESGSTLLVNEPETFNGYVDMSYSSMFLKGMQDIVGYRAASDIFSFYRADGTSTSTSLHLNNEGRGVVVTQTSGGIWLNNSGEAMPGLLLRHLPPEVSRLN